MGAPVKIVAQNISEDALKKYYYEYMSRDSRKDDSDSCEICNLPKLFHIDNRGELVIAPCDKYTTSEYMEVWKIFRQKVRPIRKWYNEILEKREEEKIEYLNGFTTLTEDIINGDKSLEDLQNYISNIGEIELELAESQKLMGIVKLVISHCVNTSSGDLELGSEGLTCHAQPKDLRLEEEQEINNKRLECNKEFGSIEELRVHEKYCYICEQCNKRYESREDLEYHRRRRHKEYNCDQCDNYGYESKEE